MKENGGCLIAIALLSVGLLTPLIANVMGYEVNSLVIACMILIGVIIGVRSGKDFHNAMPAATPSAQPQSQFVRGALGGGDGSFAVEVVGESHYQKELREIAGSGKVRMEVEAELLLESDNKYDRNAVAVWVGVNQVGYLSREDALDYRREVKAYGANFIGVCPALIVGGGKGKDFLGVWLDLPNGDDDE